MKVRTGFISNSSSSSFVVAFPHKPESVEDLKQMMFGKQEWHYADGFYDSAGRKDIPTQEIVEKVFPKIEKEATEEDVLESIKNGWFGGYMGLFPGYACVFDDPEYDSLRYGKNKDRKKETELWEKYEKINDQRAKDIANIFLRSNEDKYIVVMSFSDNEGEGVEEHTDIFLRLEHIRTSYH